MTGTEDIMNEVIKAMLERRSIRKFKPDLPPREMLDQIIEAGLYAASARGEQDPIILAFTGKDVRDKLSKANAAIMGMNGDPFYGAPAALVVLVPKSWANRVYDGSLVMGNMMLAAHSLGLGSIWIHRAKEEFETDYYKELLKDLGIEGEWEGIGHCCVGYMDCELPKAAPRKENRVYYID